jgi:Flp pilus assembly protein TadD
MQSIFSQASCQDQPPCSAMPSVVLVIATILFLPPAGWTQQVTIQPIPVTSEKPGSPAEQEYTTGQPKLPLLVSPNSIGILIGALQELRLTDSTGKHVEGAVWSVQDPGIARLDESRGVTIFGVSPGRTTVTGRWKEQTVQVKVHVLGAIEADHLAADWAVSHEPRLNPLLARPVTSSGDADFHYNRGLEFFNAGALQSAYDEFWEALRQKPDFAEAQTKLAYTLWKGGEPQGAIVAAKHALVLNPNNTDAERTIGLALVDTGDLQGAVTHYREALRLMPDSSDAHYDLGIVFDKMGQHSTSILEYREALRIEPDMLRAHYNLAKELRAIGDLSGAIAENRESVRLAPTNPSALISLAAALKDAMDLEGARRYYQAAIDIAPSTFVAHNGLGQTLYKMQDWAGAAQELAIAVELAPREYGPWLYLGISLQNAGDRARALKAFARARELAPYDPVVQKYYNEAVGAFNP